MAEKPEVEVIGALFLVDRDVPSTQCSGDTHYLLRVLAMFSFSVIMFYSAIVYWSIFTI